MPGFIGMKAECGSFVVDGVHVEYQKHRDSAENKGPLLFLHGGCHGSWSWENFLPFFAERGWDCYAPNWYNHYKSDKVIPPERFLDRSIADVTEEIGKTVAQVDRMPILIGHSMGGLAVQKFAERSSVRGLALIAPVVPAEVGGAAIELPIDQKQTWGPPPVDIARELFFQGSKEEDARRFYSLLCPESPRAVHEATRWTVHVDRKNIAKVPVIAFGAEIDRLVPHELVKNLAEHYSADYVFVPGKGHNLLLEPGWRDTASKLESWISSI